MTRLTESDIADLDQELLHYNQELIRKTGMSLGQIACLGAGMDDADFALAGENFSVSVVPITAGLGIIGGFSRSVEAIIRFLGFRTHITNTPDVDGFYEAICVGSDIVFLADDNRFIALNLKTGTVAENGIATGRGFAAALNGMAGGLMGKETLVLGLGPVGRAALNFLQEIGAQTAAFDVDPVKMGDSSGVTGVKWEKNLEESLPRYRFLVDATPQAGFLTMDKLNSEVAMALPGVPIGLSDSACSHYKERIIHDPLQIGVATMLAMVGKRAGN